MKYLLLRLQNDCVVIREDNIKSITCDGDGARIIHNGDSDGTLVPDMSGIIYCDTLQDAMSQATTLCQTLNYPSPHKDRLAEVQAKHNAMKANPMMAFGPFQTYGRSIPKSTSIVNRSPIKGTVTKTPDEPEEEGLSGDYESYTRMLGMQGIVMPPGDDEDMLNKV